MIECKFCGCKFRPVIDEHYITRDNDETGVANIFKHVESNIYDTFDCPECGCQIVVQERKRVYRDYIEVPECDEEEEEDEDYE